MGELYRVVRRTRAVKDKEKPVVYYQVRFLDDDGSIIKTKNLPDAKTERAAIRFAEAEIKAGILPGSHDPFALQYCEKFWSEDSPYFKSKKIRGRPLSESYRQSGVYGLKHFAPYLEGKKISEVKAKSFQQYADSLREKGVNPRSLNLAVEAVRRPLSVFCESQKIANPLQNVEKYEQVPKKRGVLTLDEVKKIIAYDADPRARLIVLLGALCGCRMGEARALRIENVDFINHKIIISENVVFSVEGIKAPKCDSVRLVPAPEIVLDTIRQLQEVYPGYFAVPNYNHPEWPADITTFRRAFPRVLRAIGITPEVQKKRNLVYHGLRHTFVSLMQEAGLAQFIVARLAGHKSISMTSRYSNADGLVDYDDVTQVMNRALLPAETVAGSDK